MQQYRLHEYISAHSSSAAVVQAISQSSYLLILNHGVRLSSRLLQFQRGSGL